ncbi:HAD family hydrolase [Leifsonia sp. SIMBA_070]|uniref:HAD family hydrolase n=1 Tax=Leifsonia sp. SIMBA_070 TaxID=3085810 RepID=UPI00397DDA61
MTGGGRSGQEAVVFDLYDTVIVVDPALRRAHQEALARRLRMPAPAFLGHWNATSRASNLGRIGPTEDRFREVMARAGISQGNPAELAAMEHEFLRAAAHPAPGMLPLLADLRARDVRLALLSNCSVSVRFALDGAGVTDAFDLVLLSCDAGRVKPDAEFFRLALAEVKAPPSASLYVADGVGGELEAAAALGMRAIRAAWSNPEGTAPAGTPVARTAGELAELLA